MFLETADIETASEEYATRFSGPVGEYFLARQTAITLELLKELQGARILDVGGGHGQLAEPLARKGFAITVTGSDDICKKRLEQRLPAGAVDYQTCDSLNLPFADGSFEVVMAFRLLPHVDRWQELLKELCRVAEKCVILDYPDRRSTNILYEQLFAMKKKVEKNTRPFTLFSRGQLRQQFLQNGFAAPLFRPEFLLPMVVHRKLKRAALSKALEACCSATQLTSLFGSPIIVKSCKIDG